MNVGQLRAYLDGLIAEVRGGFQSVDSAMLEIAGALDRYGAAERDIIALGETLRQMRQPMPLNPMPQGQPLPQDQATRTQMAEAQVNEIWEREVNRAMGKG